MADDPAPSSPETGFLRRFLRLAGAFFMAGDERWPARFLAGGVLLLTLLQVAIQIRINIWNRDFFDALQYHNWTAFLRQMAIFAVLGSISMGVAVYQVYVKQLLQLRWRRWLTARLIGGWLEGGRHYQLNFVGEGIENPDQRIAENIRGATEMAVDFAIGILNAALTLLSFIGILWSLSGVLSVPLFGVTLEIPGYMVAAALIYATIGSLLTYWIGRPIVAANVQHNAAEADFRFALVRLRENSESIALIGGEADEQKFLNRNFGWVMAAQLVLMRAKRRLMWMTNGYAMLGIIYPTLVASPRYFADQISLGGLMQITAAFGQVQTSLTWFVDNFPLIAEWRSHVTRLLEFEDMLQTTIESTTESGDVTKIELIEEKAKENEEAIAFENLEITLADGNVVIGETNAKIERGEKVLITGESGSGKSTLMRAASGLWPWGRGSIRLPERSTIMFMPQRPYLPLGTLRAAIAYPASPRRFNCKTMAAALTRCGLAHLVDRMDENERWDRFLSGGEQQRIAFVRALLHQPEWIFMDEATAALDDDNQTAMMKIFTEELRWTTVISVAHRPGLENFHDRTLHLVKTQAGARLTMRRRSGGVQRVPLRARLRQRITRSFATRRSKKKATSAA
jgi:vitamin B12/bleomycin/antimicrobial peptide transport system ATP-binding/permease protein